MSRFARVLVSICLLFTGLAMPVAVAATTVTPITASVMKDHSYRGNLQAKGLPTQSVTFEVVTAPVHGGVVVDPPYRCGADPTEAYKFYCNAGFTFTPDPGFVGVDKFSVRATDSTFHSGWAWVQLTYYADTVAPTGEIALDRSWTNSAQLSLSVTAKDDDGSGVISGTGVTAFRLSNSSTQAGGKLTKYLEYPYSAPGDNVDWDLVNTTGGFKGTGAHNVYAQFRDGAGNWSVPTSDAVIFDPYVPTIASVKVRLGPKSSTTNVPIRAEFPGTDTGGSGVGIYELQASFDGKPYVALAGSAASYDATLAAGHSVQYRARARDRANNIGAWTTGIKVTAGGYTETSTGVTYTGTWSTVHWVDADAYTKRSTSAGATVKLKTSARAIAIAVLTGPGHSAAKVYVDGVYKVTIDTDDAINQLRQVVYAVSFPSVGTHTVTLKNVATAGRTKLDIDGFFILK